MSREFILDEPASCFAELQRECLVDLLCNSSGDELSREDKTYLGFVKLAWQRYQRIHNKLIQANLNIQKLGNTTPASPATQQNASIPAGFTSLDSLSSDHSTLCDCTDLIFASLNEVLPGNRESIRKKLNELFDSLYCLETLEDFAPYMHLFSFANNRTIVKCEPREIGDEILLNNSDLFTKLPTWSLCLDLTGCTMTNQDGEQITGVSIMRTPFGLGAETIKSLLARKSGPHTKSKEKLNPIESDGFTLMLCTNNLSYSLFEYSFPIGPELTVLDALHEGILIDVDNGEQLEQIKKEAESQGDEFHITTVETDEGPVNLLCPEDIYLSIKEVLKYICYVMTHLSQVKDENGQPAEFKNINLIDMLPKKILASLGDRELPIRTFNI